MKIGLVIESFDSARGGAEQWTCQFAQSLCAAGHEVHVVARAFAQPLPTPIVPHQVHSDDRLQFAAAAEIILRSLRLDVVHDMGCGWYSDIFQPHGGSRIATDQHNLLASAPAIRPLKRLIGPRLPRGRSFARLQARQYADRGQRFIALSRMVRRHFEQHHGLRPDQIRLVYNGVDVRRFSPAFRSICRDEFRSQLRLDPETALVLIAAHNFRLKGVLTLIRAVSRLRKQRRPVHLAVVGGKRLLRYRALAACHGVGNAVTFAGPVHDVRPWYAAADVYVQPTFYDPCSLVVLEALACGLPVITSRFNGASELMTPGVQGFIVDNAADCRELAERMLPLVDDASLRDRMGEAARQLALEHSWDCNVRQILAIYDEVLSRRRMAA